MPRFHIRFCMKKRRGWENGKMRKWEKLFSSIIDYQCQFAIFHPKVFLTGDNLSEKMRKWRGVIKEVTTRNRLRQNRNSTPSPGCERRRKRVLCDSAIFANPSTSFGRSQKCIGTKIVTGIFSTSCSAPRM